MSTTPSGLTNDMIRKKAIYDSIDQYLQQGETKEGIVKKFGGNLDKTIQFLRARSYETLEVVKRKPKPKEKPTPKPEPSIVDPVYDPPKTDYLPRDKKKKKATKSKPSIQKGLF